MEEKNKKVEGLEDLAKAKEAGWANDEGEEEVKEKKKDDTKENEVWVKEMTKEEKRKEDGWRKKGKRR